jgi:hypothetical protein
MGSGGTVEVGRSQSPSTWVSRRGGGFGLQKLRADPRGTDGGRAFLF